MKTYKDFEKRYIGLSDIASVILAGHREGEGVVTEPLHFGQDDSYYAYFVEGEAQIGGHYEKVAEFDTWMKVYDDRNLVATFRGRKIIVYRAGEMGCIIQVLD